MLRGENLMKFEIKCLTVGQPAVHQGIELNIRVIDHLFYILGINLNHEILDVDYPDLDCLESLEETV